MSSHSNPIPHTPLSLIYPSPLLRPPKTKYDLLPSSYPITELEASRAGLEDIHIKRESRSFSSHPFVLNEHRLSHLRQHPMSKSDAHLFCSKDCAVYVTLDLADQHGSTSVGMERVFNFLYRTWFRDGEKHLDVGRFFGRSVQCWDDHDRGESSGGGSGSANELKTIKGLVEAHRLICERVREKMEDADADLDEVYEWNKRHGDFMMKTSFERCFVVVDRHVWWERGVLLIRSEKARELKGEEDLREWPRFGEGGDGWAVRMGMEEVVQLVRKMDDQCMEKR